MKKMNQQGFTLIEMAIVLVVIGLIIAAVGVGKDTMRNAEYTKVYNKFVEPWKQAAYNAFDRTGTVMNCASAVACQDAAELLGMDLAHTFIMTDEDGEHMNIAIMSIEDDRVTGTADTINDADTTDRDGGMIVTFQGPYALAKVVDRMIDANNVDSDGVAAIGDAAGDVRIGNVDGTAASDATEGEQIATFSVRLRDITGTGAVATAP
jgi:prepilin-type N-terminal cleavage/methylation domain-containing protein